MSQIEQTPKLAPVTLLPRQWLGGRSTSLQGLLRAAAYNKAVLRGHGPLGTSYSLEANISSRTQSPERVAEQLAKVSRRRARVLIALESPMDSQLLLDALKRSRRQSLVATCAASKHDIFHSFARQDIDVALINVDLEDGPLAGLQALPDLYASYPQTPVVMLFDRWQDDLVLHAFRAGAKGVFCRLERALDMLWKCIDAVHRGQVWANTRQMHLVLESLRKTAPIQAVSSPGLKSLTNREGLVATLVAEGLPNKAIALRLGISEHTVSNYLFRIYNKLGISNRVELVLHVMKDQEQSQAARLRSKEIPEQAKEAHCSTRSSSADGSGRVPRTERALSRATVAV